MVECAPQPEPWLPSMPAKGPQGLSTIQTCSIGGVARNVPRWHEPVASVVPTTRAPSQHRFWWSCHDVSSPAMSGASASVLPKPMMYMADASVRVPSGATVNTIDSIWFGSSSASSAM